MGGRVAVSAGLVVLPSSRRGRFAAQTGTGSDQGWQPLFDGKTLTNWQSTKFGGEGAVKVENGQIILDAGRA